MKKWAAVLLAALLTALCAGSLAQEMVSVAELHEQAEAMGGRWQGTYETKTGTLAIDIPVIVPDVETMPVITIERAKPLTQAWFDALEAGGRTGDRANDLSYQSDDGGIETAYFLGYEEDGLSGYDAVEMVWALYGKYRPSQGNGLLGPIEPRTYHDAWEIDQDQPFARDTDITLSGAMALLRQDIKRFYPHDDIEVHPKELEIKGSLLTENLNKGKKWRLPGEYKLYFVEQYLCGVPVLGGFGSQSGGNIFTVNHVSTRETNRRSDELEAYRTGTRASAPRIEVYAQNAENYRVDIEASRLRSVEVADVPLASLDQVMESIEMLVGEGKVESADSLRLGYMLYSNPDMTDHAWAVPRWVLDCSFATKENKDFNDKQMQMPIDAQSAQPIIITIGDEQTLAVPRIRTWDDADEYVLIEK